MLPLLLLPAALAHGGGPGFPWLLLRSYDDALPLSADAVDLGGSVTSATEDWVIAPDPTAGRIDVTFTVGPDGIAEGGGLKVTLGHVLPTAQRLYTPFSLTVTSATFFGIHLLEDAQVTCSRADVKLDVEEPRAGRSFGELLRYIRYKRTSEGRAEKDNLLRQIDNEFALHIGVKRGELRPGDTVHIVLGASKGLAPPKSEASWEVVTRVDGDGNGTYGLLADAPSFDAYTRRAEKVTLLAPTSLYPGDTSHMVLKVTDDYFLPNLARFEHATITLEPTPGLTFPTTLAMKAVASSWEGSLLEVPVTADALGVYRIRGTAVVDGRTFPVLSNPIEVVTSTTQKIYFGDLHLHSILSYDADRPPEYVYWRQRHEERHDFMALTDHDMIGTVPFATRDGARGLTEDEWAYMKSLADEHDDPGTFATIKAYEWTSYYFGHRNLFFAPEEADPPLFAHNWPADHDPGDELQPRDLQALLAQDRHRYLAIPHSTAWPTKSIVYHWGPGDAREDRFGDPDAWPEQRQLELYSTHGASEYFDNETAVDKGHPEAPTDSKLVRSLLNYDIQQAPADSGNFARDALAHEWKFGFVGSSDDHYLSHLDQAYKFGIGAVYAWDLTRRGIWQGLWDRRSYATTGVRILMRWTANGAPMGSILSPRGPVAFHAEVHGTGPLDYAEVACWDGAAWTVPHHVAANGALDLVDDWTWADAAPGRLCYLRVRQTDTDRAWSSPVWFE